MKVECWVCVCMYTLHMYKIWYGFASDMGMYLKFLMAIKCRAYNFKTLRNLSTQTFENFDSDINRTVASGNKKICLMLIAM